VAVWQADYSVAEPADGFPSDLKERLAGIAPAAKSWHSDLSTFGAEDGNRIDFWQRADEAPEMSVRVDLRELNVVFLDGIVALAATLGAHFLDEKGSRVPAVRAAFADSLRQSPAFRFVSDPAGYFERVRHGGADAG
jgi:hypothetical protein